MDSCPIEIEYYLKAFELSRKRADHEDWMLGIYIQSAVATAIEHNFAGRKAKSKYFEQPLLSSAKSKDGELSQSEITKQRKFFMASLELMKANFDLEKNKERMVEDNAEYDRQPSDSD